MQTFLKKHGVRSGENTIETEEDYPAGAKSPTKNDDTKQNKLDSKSLGTIINFKVGLERNIPGILINGNQLNFPNKPFSNDRRKSTSHNRRKPD